MEIFFKHGIDGIDHNKNNKPTPMQINFFPSCHLHENETEIAILRENMDIKANPKYLTSQTFNDSLS
jgi:hypothetical protein